MGRAAGSGRGGGGKAERNGRGGVGRAGRRGEGRGGERDGRSQGTGLVLPQTQGFFLGFRTLTLLPQTQLMEAVDCGQSAHLP